MTDSEWDIIRFFAINGGCSLCRGHALYRFAEEKGIEPREVLEKIKDLDPMDSCADDLKEKIEYEEEYRPVRLINLTSS